MKLVILGATGGVGHLLLRGAIERGADVTVIARDITDNVANDSNLRHVVHAMARTTPPSV